MCVVRGVPLGVWWHRLGPRLERTHALCGPCVSRRGLSPPACGRRTRAERHIQDIGLRMLPPSASPHPGASCTHPCCSFPCSSLRAHGTLRSPGPEGLPQRAIMRPASIIVLLCKHDSATTRSVHKTDNGAYSLQAVRCSILPCREGRMEQEQQPRWWRIGKQILWTVGAVIASAAVVFVI